MSLLGSKSISSWPEDNLCLCNALLDEDHHLLVDNDDALAAAGALLLKVPLMTPLERR